MNILFLMMVGSAFAFAAWHQFTWIPVAGQSAPMEALSAAMIQSAAGAVELAIGLVGMAALLTAMVACSPCWHA